MSQDYLVGFTTNFCASSSDSPRRRFSTSNASFAGARHDFRQFTGIHQRLLDGLLGRFGLASDLVFRRLALREVAQQSRGVLDPAADDLRLPARDGLHALDRELIGAGQRVDIAALGIHDRLEVESRQLELREKLGDVGLEREWRRHRILPR